MTLATRNTPGFQGSENSGCIVTFYRAGTDVLTTVGTGALEINGKSERDDAPCLIAAQTSKSLGAAGTFTLTIKSNQPLFDLILDDDWVDISFTKHGRKWHVMRGLVDMVRAQGSVGGSGATTSLYTVTGRDFQRIFDTTRVWFDVWTNENVLGGTSMQIFGSEGVVYSPDTAVDGFLHGFLRALGNVGRANWYLPPGMPNAPSSRAFVDAFTYDTTKFGSQLQSPRTAGGLNFLQPDGMIWELASQWSDRTYCELFTELVPTVGDYSEDYLAQGIGVDETSMAVILRDRPFLVMDPQATAQVGPASPWFSLPLFTIPRQWLLSDEIGRGGLERFNAFFCSPQLPQDLVKEYGLSVTAGNWAPTQMRAHGMRIFDMVSQYTPTNLTDLNRMRYMVRDWYSVNPYLYNGTLALACGLPAIRVGTRARVPGDTPATDRTFYVEAVAHQWAKPMGMRTNLAVTRGFVGTDAQLMNLVSGSAEDYADQRQAQPGDPGVDVNPGGNVAST